MNARTLRLVAALAIGCLLVWAPPLAADSIKQRMIDRLPVIRALKAKGVVGENNTGYLEFRGPKQHADVVAAENEDRRTVYAAIAQQQGTSVAVVGQHRAAQIARKARSGEWLEDAQGKWYRKP